MQRFVSWHEKGDYSCTGKCFDIGITTRTALARFKASGDPFTGLDQPAERRQRQPDASGAGGDPPLAGPRCLARCRRPPEPDHPRRARSGRCLYRLCRDPRRFAEILADAIRGAPRSNVLLPYNYPSAGKIASIMVSSWRGKHRDEIASSGYVAHSLEAALWCDGRTDHRAVRRRNLWGKRHSDLEGAAGLGDKISARASELFAASLERAD